MADLKTKYGADGTALTITLASLANAARRQSVYVDNATDLFLNALVMAKLKTASSGVSATGYINIYAYASTDGGTIYSGQATGTDAAHTAEKANLVLVASLTANANSMDLSAAFDIASAFGGALPKRWGVVVENQTGAALDATGGNHSITYQGVQAQSV